MKKHIRKPVLFLIILFTVNFIASMAFVNGSIDIGIFKYTIGSFNLALVVVFYLIKPNSKYMIILYITAIIYSTFETMSTLHYYEQFSLPLSVIFFILTFASLYKANKKELD